MLLYSDEHFSLNGNDAQLWINSCVNADVSQRMYVYLKAALMGRVDVLERLAPTFDDTPHVHNDALCAAIVLEQFECADCIERDTNVDISFIQHIFNHAASFNFDAEWGRNILTVNNDKPFFQHWLDHKNMEQCRIQKETIEHELESNNSSRLRKI